MHTDTRVCRASPLGLCLSRPQSAGTSGPSPTPPDPEQLASGAEKGPAQRRGPTPSPERRPSEGRVGQVRVAGHCPGSLRRGATGPSDRQMGRKCGPESRAGLRGGGPRHSQPHPKANSPSLGGCPAPTCTSWTQTPAQSDRFSRDPRRLTGGRPGPHTPGGFGRQHGWGSYIFSLGNTSPVVPPGQGIPTLSRGKLRPAWGPGGPCRAWWGGGRPMGAAPQLPAGPPPGRGPSLGRRLQEAPT